MKKEIYIIKNDVHMLPVAVKVLLRNADLFDVETNEWTAHVAKTACEAKIVAWYHTADKKIRFIVEMTEFDGIAVYDVSAKDIAKALERKAIKLIWALIGGAIAEAAGGIIENIVGMFLF